MPSGLAGTEVRVAKPEPHVLAHWSDIKAATSRLPSWAGAATAFFAGVAFSSWAPAEAARELQAKQILPDPEGLAQLALFQGTSAAAVVSFIVWVFTATSAWAASKDLRAGKKYLLTPDQRLIDASDEDDWKLKGWRAWLMRQLHRVLMPS